MANYIDLQYTSLVSSQLDRYRVKNHNPFKANFRCPFCMDSKKSKAKARGWFLESNENNNIGYYCFNCFKSISLLGFLNEIDPTLYRSYISEKFIEGNKNVDEKPTGIITSASSKSKIISVGNPQKTISVVNKTYVDPILEKIRCLDDMPNEHPSIQYLKQRKIPREKYNRFYYVAKFKKWTNELIPNKYPERALETDEPRLIIPFCDENGKLFGYTGRSFDPDEELRYITIMLNQNKSKFYGLDTVDTTKQYYVLEGAIDSMFIDNAMAMAGADAKIENLKDKKNCIIVYDNEPRNPDVHFKMEQAIQLGFKILIWPSNIKSKDVNSMIVDEGLTESQIHAIVSDENNICSGLYATIKMAEWRKVLKKDDFYKMKAKEQPSQADEIETFMMKMKSGGI